MNAIRVTNLTVAYTHEPVLWQVTITIPSGIMLGIIGPNGAGKSTFIKALLGLVKPITGTIVLLHNTPGAIAYVPQRASVDWDFPLRVYDVVMMGRFAHLGIFARPKKDDHERVLQALQLVGMSDYAQRPIGQLSGGQQQRVFVARALAQDAEIYMLDEPFNGVDAKTELIIIDILKNLRVQGKTVLVVHHNIHTCEKYFDALLYLDKTVKGFGPVRDVLALV
ncbi:MAG: ABC transporter ATP-binding protein [Candidatus Babeliales bacterium]